MAKEQRGLISLVGSPLVKIKGTWRWFITMAQADVYEPRLYEICLEGNSGQENHNWCWSDRQKIAKELTKEEREKILKRHPALTARMFDLKQSCIWDCIINGKHQPLGKIIDTWRRIEFQLRGTPHSHGMACVIHDGILAEFFDAEQHHLKPMLSRTPPPTTMWYYILSVLLDTTTGQQALHHYHLLPY